MGFFNSEHPLGLPKGSVRAIILLVSLLTVAIGIHRPIEIPQEMWALLIAAFAFYYGTKAANGSR